jgi:hypothetical protein|tara:strand:- start:213 stop:368 length:156 start_codon:yes stop_codon:yes gene_type:complete
MNFKWDLKKPLAELKRKASTFAILRKRSQDSQARPKAKKNILSKDDRMQGI